MRRANSKPIRTEAGNRFTTGRASHGWGRRAAARHRARPGRGVLLERRGCRRRMDPELNYFNYFTEIERFYQSKRESFTLLSTLDWVLIENWKEEGLPLDIVLKGIDRAFSRAKRRINSLAYCVKAVEEVCEEQKGLTVETSRLPDFSADEVVTYIRKLADQVQNVDPIIAESIRNLDSCDLRMAEQTLSALEEKLIAKLKATADDKTMI